MKISNKEVESVSSLESFKRYRYFIKKIADFEEVWTIKDENGEFALSDIDENTLISLWPAKEFIESNLSKGWRNCVPIRLDLEKLKNEVVSFLLENSYVINVFPINGKSGFIVSVEEFVRDLNEELKNYE